MNCWKRIDSCLVLAKEWIAVPGEEWLAAPGEEWIAAPGEEWIVKGTANWQYMTNYCCMENVVFAL